MTADEIPRRIAVHEAGHAVAGYVFTQRKHEFYKEVSLRFTYIFWEVILHPPGTRGRAGPWGECKGRLPFTKADTRPRESPCSSEVERCEAKWRIRVGMAGPIVDAFECGLDPTTWHEPQSATTDLRDVKMVLRHFLHPGDKAAQLNARRRLEADTVKLVETWRPTIDRLADALLDRLSLGGDEVVAIIGDAMPALASPDMRGLRPRD